MHADLQEGEILPCSGYLPVKLCDKTRIGGQYWKTLKKEAMVDNYKSNEWYSEMNKNEKKLLEDLRTAQSNQGDMEKLKVTQEKTMSNDQKAILEKQKLIFGLLWGLKSFSQQVTPTPLAQTFRDFSTSRYKLHVLEIQTGIKFILITRPI